MTSFIFEDKVKIKKALLDKGWGKNEISYALKKAKNKKKKQF